jgi:hypothetical protein
MPASYHDFLPVPTHIATDRACTPDPVQPPVSFAVRDVASQLSAETRRMARVHQQAQQQRRRIGRS